MCSSYAARCGRPSVGIAPQLEAPQGQQEEPQRLPETMQQPSAAPQPEAPDEQQEEPQRLDDAVMPEGPPQQEDTNVTVTSLSFEEVTLLRFLPSSTSSSA